MSITETVKKSEPPERAIVPDHFKIISGKVSDIKCPGSGKLSKVVNTSAFESYGEVKVQCEEFHPVDLGGEAGELPCDFIGIVNVQ